MWSPWMGQSPRVHSASPNSSFNCSSFKDVHLLCSSDDNSAEDFSKSDNKIQLPPRYRQIAAKNIFHRVRLASSLLRNWPTRTGTQTLDEFNGSNQAAPAPRISLPGTEDRIVVYLTSLRVIRRTYDACRSVQSILDGFRVNVDERDIAMYPGFLDELQQILGFAKQKLTLPKVFVGGRYIGGAEELWQLYETGELKKLVEELPATRPTVCEACGGFRFLLCGDCNGSHKVYCGKGGFRCCTECNVDGLIKCPVCYPTALLPR